MFYQTEEKAFAPGIVKEWPNVIPHPQDKNGRLSKVDVENLNNQIKVAVAEYFLTINKADPEPFIPPTAIDWLANGIVKSIKDKLRYDL